MQIQKTLQFRFLLIFLVFSSQLVGQTITIGTGGDFTTLSAAESSITPGDSIIISDQTFTDGAQFLNSVNGTATQPVVIIAATSQQPIFQGGSEAIHLINCNYIELNGLVFEQQTSNGVNIDDGGDYSSPSTNITIRNCIFRDIANPGNHDLLKMSGVDSFLIENCTFYSGTGGSGIDLVGCHTGIIQDCTIDNAGLTGIQCKGGAQYITIRRNIFKNMSERALNLGGSTGIPYFRPPLPSPIVDAFEAADLNVYANIFVGNKAPIAYVGCVRVKVINNTFYKPEHWVIRILQETVMDGFTACSNNEFSNNIVYLETDLTEVNIGSSTAPGTFVFTNNLWFNKSSSSWTPVLPVVDPNQIIADPLFTNGPLEDFTLQSNSPAIASGLIFPDLEFDFVLNPYLTPPSIGAYERNSTTDISPSRTFQNNVRVYPNPSNGNFFVDLGVGFQFSKIAITDLCGKVVQSNSNTQSQLLNLNIEESAGVYLLIIKSEAKREVFRLVKE